ncbi:FtsX-like permease family protein [Alistipes sp.]|uniref:FtsX-like permease family protein n=1 Tax=Alistipes sp. TaxID=1872444 RepID=UPI000E9FDBFA|nr:FtsX-like permease family protein [Alistipes sp.]HAY30076.1 ABC transporter permease [Alistipes sp.]
MPRLPLFFARRYLFSKKSHSVINIVSGVSAFSVAIPVMAMVILLSVFNGFEGLIKSMYRSFDPDIRITPVRGKVFPIDSLPRERFLAIDGVRDAAYALEDNAVFEYRDRQAFGTMCGVDSLYRQVVPLDSLRTEGVFQLQFGDFPEAYVGQGMAYALGIRVNLNSPISVYVPRRGRVSPLLPYSFYKKQNIFPSGVFALEAEVDGKYVIVPLHFAQQLLDYPGQASSVAIRLEADASPQRVQRVQQQIGQWLGDDYKIQSRYQQKESFYRIMMYEKWGIYFIILLVLVIASFSLIGSLVMLIIEKRKDSQTLVTMGADTKLLRKIFVAEGMLIYLIGAGGGLLLGVALALAQQHFGFLKLSGETFLIDAYPVEVHPSDLAWVIVTFVSVSYLISVLTVRAMIPKKEISQNRP